MLNILLLLGFILPTAISNNLEGKWATGLNNTIVEITTNYGVLTGKITDSDDKKLIGITVIKTVVKNKNGTYSCEIYDPKLKKYFDATLESLQDGKLKVKATCCLGFFSETYFWQRI
jgi:uncharacterized protein (DUF2147 family)